jgi:hypothetical protein
MEMGLGLFVFPSPPLGRRGRAIRQTDTQLHSTPEGRRGGDPPLGKKRLRGIERSAERAGNLERGAGLVWFGLGGVGCRTEEREEV